MSCPTQLEHLAVGQSEAASPRLGLCLLDLKQFKFLAQSSVSEVALHRKQFLREPS